jgi:flagellar hook-associated protein 3 FlgL
MRVSTELYFQQSLRNIQASTLRLNQTQQQLSTGLKFLTPSDDPVASSKVVKLTEGLELTKTYQNNVNTVRTRLSTAEGVLGEMDDTLQRIRELALQSNSGSLSLDDRKVISTEMQQLNQQLRELMNSQDGLGAYLFGGYQTQQLPFTERNGGGFDFNGDEGQNQLQVALTTRLPTGLSAKPVFVDLPSSTKSVLTAAEPTNQSTTAISAGVIVDQDAFDAHFPEDYRITFNDPELNQDRTTYTITQVSDGKPVMGTEPAGFMVNLPFTSGEVIEFNGIQVRLSGEPVFGDSFTVASSQNQSLLNTVYRYSQVLDNSISTSLFAPEEVPVIGRATAAAENLSTAGNYVAAQTVRLVTSTGSVETVTIDANESTDNIVTQLNTLSGVTAVALDTEATLDFSHTIAYQGETISFAINGVSVTAVAGATPAATYAALDTQIAAALASLPTMAYTNNADGTFSFTETNGADISIANFAVTALPRLDMNVLGGFNVGDAVAFTLTGSAGQTVNIAYTVATGTVDELFAAMQTDIVAAGVSASIEVTQLNGAGTAIRLRYLGDTNGDARLDVTNFTDGGADNAQLSVTPVTGTTVTLDGTTSTIISAGFDYQIAAQENRRTLQFQGSVGEAVTLIEGSLDSSAVAAEIGLTLSADYELTSEVAAAYGGLFTEVVDRQILAEQRVVTATQGFLTDLQLAQDNVSRFRSELGARLNALDEIESLNESLIIETETLVSQLRDVDFADATTRLNLHAIILEAAQSSFVKVSRLNLFNLL